MRRSLFRFYIIFICIFAGAFIQLLSIFSGQPFYAILVGPTGHKCCLFFYWALRANRKIIQCKISSNLHNLGAEKARTELHKPISLAILSHTCAPQWSQQWELLANEKQILATKDTKDLGWGPKLSHKTRHCQAFLCIDYNRVFGPEMQKYKAE